jgi:hypothetical protein
MSDYRNPDNDFRDPEDPYRRDVKLDPDARAANAAWGWIAAAVFLVVVLAVAFGVGHQPGQPNTNTASNEVNPPAATQMLPPTTIPTPSMSPAPAAPAPITPAPGAPAQGSVQ